MSALRVRARTDFVPCFLALCVVACTSTSPSTTTTNAAGFSTTPLGSATSSTKMYSMTMYGPPAGVVQGLNTIEIDVVDTNNAPVDDLSISIVPWMPTMGHGTSVIPQIQPKGGGVYVATDVALIMPGLWQLRTALTPTEEAIVSFELQ